MPLLDLLYLNESDANAVIAAVRRWCAETGTDIHGAAGKEAILSAVRISKTSKLSPDHFAGALTSEGSSVRSEKVDCILVLEDEPLIALDIEESLVTAGSTVKLSWTRSQAIRWLESSTPTAAIIDLQLRDGPTIDVVARLQDLGVPVVIFSGGLPEDMPPQVANLPLLPKPHTERALFDTLQAAIKAVPPHPGSGDVL